MEKKSMQHTERRKEERVKTEEGQGKPLQSIEPEKHKSPQTTETTSLSCSSCSCKKRWDNDKVDAKAERTEDN